jgi:hypothetical protein
MTRTSTWLRLSMIVAAGAAAIGCAGTSRRQTHVTTAPAAARAPAPVEAPPIDACSRAGKVGRDLVALVGDWHGRGWIELRPGRREQFDQRESVRCALGGEILVIEGRGTARGRGQRAETVVHQALGVVSHDSRAASYLMRAYSAGRPAVDSPLELSTAGDITWGFAQGPVQIRFRIRISDGAWHEVGEMSLNGGSWRQFFEMRLQRKEP